MTTRRAAERTPVVPLEAGAGPQNPPCPACGEPLFGWVEERLGLSGPVRRCESCGLGAVGDPGDATAALRELDRLGDGPAATIANRGGLSAALGEAGWAGLERGSRYLFTVEAVRRLVARRDQVVSSARWSPRRGIGLMWQTILNAFTFGRNGALARFGHAGAAPAPATWQRRLDALIGIAVAIPALIVAVPLELAGAALGRGSAISLRFELL